MEILIPIIAAFAACILGFFAGYVCRRKIAENTIGGAEQKANEIIEEGRREAETKKKRHANKVRQCRVRENINRTIQIEQ